MLESLLIENQNAGILVTSCVYPKVIIRLHVSGLPCNRGASDNHFYLQLSGGKVGSATYIIFKCGGIFKLFV